MSYGGYGGNCCCSVIIDRYKDLDTGKLYTEREIEEFDLDKKFEYQEVELDVEGNAYYIPGCLDRAPEDCYPDDSNLEIESVTDEDGNDWEPKLTKDEIEMIEDKIINLVKDPY
jgi:hypothetical protein